MNEEFKARLRRREILIGPMLTLGSTEVAEIMSRAGFDWLWIDMEHAPTGLETVQKMIQAAGERVPCLVRAPRNDEVWIKHILDLGCDGIVIPQIRTADEARRALQACKYPPDGTRSVGIGRAQGYGMTMQPYLDVANDDVTVVLQAEHIDAAENIEAILEVSGIDAVFIGPYDLSASLGIPGQISHPDVADAIRAIITACTARNVPIGMFAVDVKRAKSYIEAGATFIALGVDAIYLWRSAMQALQELRG